MVLLQINIPLFILMESVNKINDLPHEKKECRFRHFDFSLSERNLSILINDVYSTHL